MVYARFDKYRKARTVQFLNDALDIFTLEDAKKLKLESKYKLLIDTIDKLNAIWKSSRGSKLTSQLKELDTLRGSIYAGFKVTIDTWSRNHFDDAKRKMAKEVISSVQVYSSGFNELPYQEETAVLRSLVKTLNDLHTDKLIALNMQDWIIKLEEVNNQFEKRYIERTQELSVRNEGEINKARQEAVASYRTLISLFDARFMIAEDENNENLDLFKKISNQLKQLAEQHNAAALRTKDSQKGAEIDDDEEIDDNDDTTNDENEVVENEQ